MRSALSIGTVVGVLGLFAILAPLSGTHVPQARVGFLLAIAACLEIAHGLRRSTEGAQRAASASGGISLLMALLLINAPYLAGAALVLFLAGTFALDGIRSLVGLVRERHEPAARLTRALPALGNVAAATLLFLLREQAEAWTVAGAGALRIFGVAWNIFTAPVHTADDAADTVIKGFALSDDPELAALGTRLESEEQARGSVDRGWVVAFLLTLFAIHIARMGTDRTFLGLAAPAVAVAGDMVIALLITYGVLVPLHLSFRKLTRGLERRGWAWCLGGNTGWIRRGVRAWLTARLRFALRLRAARYSLGTTLSRGLQIGLPLAGIIAATTPVWGMSWYFDTENWAAAAGMWNSWAETRTDTWREAMVGAARARNGAGAPRGFRIDPPGIGSGADFSFIVIGDTGEGDASQHILRDQLLQVSGRDDVRFIVVSSDVVYPTGAMKDYEAKFWLPFKGVTKPVYAIPGNHDWYDALEAFAATFFEAEAARAAMRARVATDRGLTSTTEERIDELIEQAARLRSEYRVPTGFQQAPFFHFQTDRFALIAIDTGVLKRVDDAQLAWLRDTLRVSSGKMTMAILGHPFYAGGYDQTSGHEEFTALYEMLRDGGVAVAMAGDTHDLEYYRPDEDGGRMHHFVNGGGGAYLSFGASLAWPAEPAVRQWAFYPSQAPVVAKIGAQTPYWKAPAWWWTRRFGAWPFSAEWLSAAFDYNVAPFFQSFVEVRVEPCADRIRILPYGVHGRLSWSDLDTSSGLRPAGMAPDDPVEWVIAR